MTKFFTITEYIKNIIQGTKFERHIYIVEGSIRDIIMKRPIKDEDCIRRNLTINALYYNISTGYGALLSSNANYYTLDLGCTFNFAALNNTSSFGIGLGTRCDFLLGLNSSNTKKYAGVDVLVGPFFHVGINRALSLNITAGPLFYTYYVDNLSKERYAIGPGVDGAITITPPTFDNISFSFGSLVAAAFSLNNDPTSIFVVPYISFNIHFNQSYYTPYPYGALVIY